MDWTLLLWWHLESQRNFVLKNLDKCYGHLVGTNQGCPTTHRIVKELTSPKCNSLLSWSILSLSDPCLNVNFHSITVISNTFQQLFKSLKVKAKVLTQALRHLPAPCCGLPSRRATPSFALLQAPWPSPTGCMHLLPGSSYLQLLCMKTLPAQVLGSPMIPSLPSFKPLIKCHSQKVLLWYL